MATLFEVTPLSEARSYRLAGELDMSTADKLAEVLIEDCRSPGQITLDLTELTFLDSSGLHVLLEACGTLGENGDLVLRNPSRVVARVFDVSGISRFKGIRVEH
jgi:anti-sigma B factor antagonist